MGQAIVITTDGPVAATTLVWRLADEVKVTAIAKMALRYADSGAVEVAPAPTIVDSDLAPILSKPEVIFVGTAHGEGASIEASLRIERDGTALLEKTTSVPNSAPAAALGGSTAGWPFAPGAIRSSSVVVPLGSHEAFQRTPPDQRLETLLLDEEIVLAFLHPRRSRLRLRLPNLSVTASAKIAGEASELTLRADTLHIDGSAQLCHVTWRSVFSVEIAQLARTTLHVAAVAPTTAEHPKTRPMPARARRHEATPFTKRDAPAPPLASDLHSDGRTGTLHLGASFREQLKRELTNPSLEDAPAEKGTEPLEPLSAASAPAEPAEPYDPQRALSTVSLSREALREAAKQEAVPFEPTGPKRQRPAKNRPIEGAPWSPAEAKPVPDVTDLTAHTTLALSQRIPRREAAPEEPPQEEAPKESAPKPLERPLEPHVRGPEMGPLDTSKIKTPKKKRKDLNAALYDQFSGKKKS